MCSLHRVVASALVLLVTSCEREVRELRPSHSASAQTASQHGRVGVPVGPGASVIEKRGPAVGYSSEGSNAYDLAEGKRLFSAYNCTGCHANGGGGMGPALMDRTWIYGHDPQQVYTSIVAGRPNGMPSFAGRIPEFQAWQIVAYVRSMSGLVHKSAAPGRADQMSTRVPENSTSNPPPADTGAAARARKQR
jgi:cytochrome c oxidase cbb3-type subunit 3